MAVKRKSRSFKDIRFSFVPHPVTKDLPVLINERAIVRSVRNIVETIPTEKYFNPIFGTDVRDSLFENYTNTTVTVIRDQIKTAINNFEPRVENVACEVKGLPDSNTFEVTVFFDILGLGLPKISFSFLLEPTR